MADDAGVRAAFRRNHVARDTPAATHGETETETDETGETVSHETETSFGTVATLMPPRARQRCK